MSTPPCLSMEITPPIHGADFLEDEPTAIKYPKSPTVITAPDC
ncbi:hypothetical protein AYI70_g3203, partial [Smittium culicis]